MDCGPCNVATVVDVHQPDPVQATVYITEAATKMLSEVMGCKDALLVGVLSGGCSGYMYDLQIVENADGNHQEIEIQGLRILIPQVASHLLDGIQIDYIDQLMGGGFKINNPNAKASCGCGESFS